MLHSCLIAVRLTSEVDVFTDPENTVLGCDHVIASGSLSDDDNLLGLTTFTQQDEDSVSEIAFVGGSHFCHLTLNDDSNLFLLLVICNSHAFVLVIIGGSVIEGVLARGGDNPRDITVVLHAGYRGFLEHGRVENIRVSSGLVWLVLTAEEKIVVILRLRH